MTGKTEWWTQGTASSYLQQALSHINKARRAEVEGQDDLDTCRLLFDSLNQLWTAFRSARGTPGDSDSKAFRDMLADIPPERAKSLCCTPAFSDLVYLSPHVMNHDVLRGSQDYRPNQPVTERLARRAQEEHRRLVNAHEPWRADASQENTTRLLKRLAALLYVVRSNIAHGEKAPYAPDLDKGRRDRQVCAAVRPVLWLLVDALLDHPAKRLAVYGTLAPGGSNHGLLSHLPGKWDEADVQGELSMSRGLPVLKWRTGFGQVNVWVLGSSALEGEWATLDRFESTLYRRIMVPVVFRDGRISVANLYEASEP